VVAGLAEAAGVAGKAIILALRLRCAALVVLLGLAGFSGAATAAGAAAGGVETYATADEAVSVLITALRGGKPLALLPLFGPASQTLLASGDRYADASERKRFLDAYDEQHQLRAAEPDRMVLEVGKQDWPLPIPIVEAGGRWHFDATAGAEELVRRRIGRNEIAAIRTSLAYVDAQKAFFAMTGAEGQAEYAQRLLSSPGKYDGLYWPAAEGQPDSPLEALVAQARDEGYPVDTGSGQPRPYHGYYYRILTEQGASTPEGARNYTQNGRMTAGFGLIAWPASYGASGLMTFMVNQDGVVFQKDLGPRTAQTASAAKLFNPDLSWARVDLVDERK